MAYLAIVLKSHFSSIYMAIWKNLDAFQTGHPRLFMWLRFTLKINARDDTAILIGLEYSYAFPLYSELNTGKAPS